MVILIPQTFTSYTEENPRTIMQKAETYNKKASKAQIYNQRRL